MSTRRMMGIYNNLYNQINKYYNEEYLSIQKACDKVNISTSKYYDLCRKLGKKSVAIEGIIKDSIIKRGTKESIPKKDITVKKGTKESIPKKDVTNKKEKDLKLKKGPTIKKGTKDMTVKKTLKAKVIPNKPEVSFAKQKKKITKPKIMKGGHISTTNDISNADIDNKLDDRMDDRFDDRTIEKDNDIINIFVKTNNEENDSEASLTGFTEMIDM